MNVERLTEIAEWLEAGAPHKGAVDGFNMVDYTTETDCGTCCCIAGAANAFAGQPLGSEACARGLLDLRLGQAEELFAPNYPAPADWGDVTPAWAARCIRKLIATGEVDWEGTRDV